MWESSSPRPQGQSANEAGIQHAPQRGRPCRRVVFPKLSLGKEVPRGLGREDGGAELAAGPCAEILVSPGQ